MENKQLIHELQMLYGKIGRAKERIDVAESDLNRLISLLKNEETQENPIYPNLKKHLQNNIIPKVIEHLEKNAE